MRLCKLLSAALSSPCDPGDMTSSPSHWPRGQSTDSEQWLAPFSAPKSLLHCLLHRGPGERNSPPLRLTLDCVCWPRGRCTFTLKPPHLAGLPGNPSWGGRMHPTVCREGFRWPGPHLIWTTGKTQPLQQGQGNPRQTMEGQGVRVAGEIWQEWGQVLLEGRQLRADNSQRRVPCRKKKAVELKTTFILVQKF